MLDVFQGVESIYEMQTGFSLFVNNYQFSNTVILK